MTAPTLPGQSPGRPEIGQTNSGGGSEAVAEPGVQLISWNLTRVCNLACGHCYLDAVQRRNQAADELSTAEALAVLGDLGGFADGAMLVLTGGEPLLRRDLEQLVAAASAQGLMPVIGTNGTLLDAGRARALRAAGAVGVGISLDSIQPEFHDRLRGQEGAWARAMAGIAAAREAGLAVQLQMSLFRENRTGIAAMADLAEHLGALALNLFFLVCTGRGVSQTDLSEAEYEAALADILRIQDERGGLMVRARCAPYLRRMAGLHVGERRDGYAEWSSACLAGRAYFRIAPCGDVTPCPYIPQAVGNVRTVDASVLWAEDRTFQRLRRALPQGKCGQCDYRLSCGGCRARALAAGGDLMGEDAKCGYVRPADAVPEMILECRSGVVWDAEAERLLARIPGFVRGRVRGMVEKKAREAGIPLVTAEFMGRHRPPAIVPESVLARFRGSGP
jgi:radical SAM protein with 4Fe4S-binding SPASM domain